MPLYVALRPDIEVLGQPALNVFSAMGPHASLGIRIAARHGIKNMVPTGWYPQQAWLNTLREICESTGENTLFSVGKRIPELAVWPADLPGIEAAMAALDVVYHLNHRRGGQVMYDPSTGTMLEGIGRYSYRSEGKRRGVMVCENPYPSDLDRGIISGVARRYQPTVEVEQDDGQPSRKRGGESCTFIIRW
jgi:hypothetical protein